MRCPRSSRRPPATRRPTARSRRSSSSPKTTGRRRELMGNHPPVDGLGDRLRPHRRAVGGRPVPDLGRAAREVPGRPQRPLRRRVVADPARGHLRHRLRHRELHVPQRRRDRVQATGPVTAGRRAADLVRPAVPPRCPPAHPPAAFPEGGRRIRGVDPRLLRRADRRHGRQGSRRRRRRVRPAHPGAGDLEDARLPGGGRRSVPDVHPQRARRRRQALRVSVRSHAGAVRATSSTRSTTISPIRGTTSPPTC